MKLTLKRTDFFYELPEDLIAQVPLKQREKSKLMVLDKESGDVKHTVFENIIDYLNEGDCLVLNNTRVLPARIFGKRKETGGAVEFLLLTRLEGDKWETLVKPGRKAKIGDIIEFGEGLLEAQVVDIKEDGIRIVEFKYEGIFEEILDKLGEMPLPPYIKEKLQDKERYQTVYSKKEGSAAAPTAGLHFTQELMDAIRKKGVKIVYITLHVGLGTFRPVKEDDLSDHKMHSEYYEIDQDTADIINMTKQNGNKVIAVGTTSTRTLESVCDDDGQVVSKRGWTDIFIYPGYKFRVIDALITNFHLPESTLIMLISALTTREIILNAYEIAVRERYRFFSFGDAMLII
ncbi:tRNA preQ1(34) S-adenosylmethionine ribosyltransferase-isomerase QueA [Clostridiaceae bacterium M8S5]|nr:tRNA preQ1(34) S-adenosylmethionine ribosyltransferase-isomerase QueA [Clostridiaceae bacterium M8S5]